MIEIGETVGNYRITAKLGEGGMGEVFLAEHPVIGRKVALKAIHPQFARNPEVVGRFVTEARAVNQIGHAHIVDVTDFGHTAAGDFYFIMEYLQGEMLSAQIGRVPFPPARAMGIAAQIADALAASHRQGVVHRDLKPDNILLVDRDGSPDFVKVFDFGLAKLMNVTETLGRAAETGVVMGTPFYMSPEQCDATREVDHRADIYALGVILFQMSTGRVPFSGEGFGEIMAKHLTCAAPALRALVPEVPPALEAIVGRALAKEPDQRFQTMAELRETLLAADGQATSAPAIVRETETPVQTDLRSKQSRGRGLLFGMAAFALVGVADLGWHRHVTEVLAAATGPRASSVQVNFSSDPDGATVSRRDGSVVGVTPFSTEIPAGDDPVEYIVHKDGYLAKVTAFVPNMPQPLFAVLEREPAPPAQEPADAPAAAERRPAPARHGRSHAAHRPTPAVVHPIDSDDIMAPSTW